MPPDLPLDLRQAGDSEPGREPWHVDKRGQKAWTDRRAILPRHRVR